MSTDHGNAVIVTPSTAFNPVKAVQAAKHRYTDAGLGEALGVYEKEGSVGAEQLQRGGLVAASASTPPPGSPATSSDSDRRTEGRGGNGRDTRRRAARRLQSLSLG